MEVEERAASPSFLKRKVRGVRSCGRFQRTTATGTLPAGLETIASLKTWIEKRHCPDAPHHSDAARDGTRSRLSDLPPTSEEHARTMGHLVGDLPAVRDALLSLLKVCRQPLATCSRELARTETGQRFREGLEKMHDLRRGSRPGARQLMLAPSPRACQVGRRWQRPARPSACSKLSTPRVPEL